MQAADSLYLSPEAVDGWFRLLVALIHSEHDEQAKHEWITWVRDSFSPVASRSSRNTGNRIGNFVSDEIRGASVDNLRRRRRKGQTSMLEKIAQQRQTLAAAEDRYDAQIAELYHPNGSPKLGAHEMKQRIAEAGAELARAADAAKQLASQARVEVANMTGKSGQIDQIMTLQGEDLARANQLMAFVREGFSLLSISEIQQRINAAIADNDRVLALLYARQSEYLRRSWVASGKPAPQEAAALAATEEAVKKKFAPSKIVGKPQDIRAQADALRTAAVAAEAKAATRHVVSAGPAAAASRHEF